MGNRLVLVLTVMFVAAVAMVALAEEVKTIKGEVIDISCYVPAGAKGEEHKACALACLKAGEPAGILEDGTGKVYIVVTGDHTTNPSAKVLPFAAKMVEVTGSVSEKDGLSVIDIKDIKEAQAVPAGTMEEKKGMGGY